MITNIKLLLCFPSYSYLLSKFLCLRKTRYSIVQRTMNSFGWSILFRMGCICSRQSIEIDSRKYYIKETIDDGGFSTIYLVEQHGNRKKFALKKMICHGLEDQKIAMQEVEYHNMLKHPNILPCLAHTLTDKGVDPFTPTATIVYMLLPLYCRGTVDRDLKLREKTNTHLPLIDLLKLFIQICEGIKVFHCFRPTPLAHRDIKPSNVLLSPDGTPTIMDLGSTAPAIVFVKNSMEAQALQDYASSRCTLTYRAPELFHVEVNSTIDQRTDIWSLGCLLYALCFYKSPFDYVHEKGDSVPLAVVSGRITFPADSPYPESLHDLILSLLKLSPEERPFIDEVRTKANLILTETNNTVSC